MGKLWHGDARVRRLTDAGTFAGGGRKIVLHTTEGTSLEGALSALASANAASHFVVDLRLPLRKGLVQCIPLNLAARALEHPSGPDTNRANAIQIEIVGYAAESEDWSDAAYDRLASLCNWIHRNFDVPRKCDVTFKASGSARRMGGQEFFDYAGYCGHEHVPGNDHTDPGNLHVDRLLPKRNRD